MYACFTFSVSGCTDHFEEDEESALETTRTIVATLNTEQSATPSGQPTVLNLASRNFILLLRTREVSISQSVNQSISQSVNQSISQSVNQSISQSVSQSLSLSVSQSVNQSITHLHNQSVNPTICQ